MAGILYAIPTPLGGATADALPAPALQTVKTLRTFVVENAKSARAFLKEVGMPCPIQELEISVLESDVAKHIKQLQKNMSIGLLSEAGCPAIADPGADRKSTRLNSSHTVISYAVFCFKKKKTSCDRIHNKTW